MYCSQCGALLKDGAKFCSQCGVPVEPKPEDVESAAEETAQVEVPSALQESKTEVTPSFMLTPTPAAEQVNKTNFVSEPEEKKRSLADTLMEKRTLMGMTVPTFVAIIAAFILSATVAYAAYKLITEVIIPAFQPQETAIEEVVPEEEGAGAEPATTEAVENPANTEAHVLYEGVIQQYQDLFSDGVQTSNGGSEEYYSLYPYVNFEVIENIDGAYTLDSLFYTYIDLDENGVDELLVGMGALDSDEYSPSNWIVAAYSVDSFGDDILGGWYQDFGDGLYMFLGSMTRDHSYLSENNCFVAYGSGGAYINGLVVEQYQNGVLDSLESVSSDRNDTANTITLSHYVGDELVESYTEEKPENGSSQTYISMLDTLQAKYPVNTSAVWTPLSE